MRSFFTLLLLTALGLASAQNITGYEYWFDQADTSRTLVPVAPNTAIDLTESIPAGALSNGPHTAHYRLLDNHGYWGSVLSKPFSVLPDGPREQIGRAHV